MKRGSDANDGFAQSIKGVSLLRTDEFDGRSTRTSRFSLVMLLGCGLEDRIRLGGPLYLEDLALGQRVLVSDDNPNYDFHIACTSGSDCEELQVTVTRKTPAGVSAFVHIPMKGKQFENDRDGLYTNYEYTSRNLRHPIANTYDKGSTAWYWQEICLKSDAETHGSEEGSDEDSELEQLFPDDPTSTFI